MKYPDIGVYDLGALANVRRHMLFYWNTREGNQNFVKGMLTDIDKAVASIDTHEKITGKLLREHGAHGHAGFVLHEVRKQLKRLRRGPHTHAALELGVAKVLDRVELAMRF